MDKVIKLQVFCEESTIHGLKYIGGKNIHVLRRIIWLLVLCVFMGYLLYVMCFSLQRFYQFETTISTSHHEAKELLPPSVTVCPLYRYLDYLNVEALQQNYPQYLIDYTYYYFLKNYNSFDNFNETLENFLQNEAAIDFLQIGKSIPIEAYCGKNCSIRQLYVSDFYHMCYTASHNKRKVNTTGLFGNVNALEIVFDLSAFRIQSDFWAFLAMVHHPEVMPSKRIETFTLAPYQTVHMALEQEISTSLGKPYSETGCVDADPLYDQGTCINECIRDAQYSEYNCSVLSNIRNCSIYEYYKHFNDFTSQEEMVRYRNDNCKHCIPRCMQTKYKVNLITTDTDGPWFELFIYFRILEYTVKKEIALVELDQLLSNIGGLLGLFIGASVLSVLEILDWVSVLICQRFYRKCKEYRIEEQHPNQSMCEQGSELSLIRIVP